MPPAPISTKSASPRIYALDALRGLAILAMLLSGQLPFDGNALPAWMYHAQEPPPTFQWSNSIYGITWVDLVFPFFLFSMGASFPLALGRRLAEAKSPWKTILGVLERGVLLGFFALYVQAIRPYTLSHHPDTQIFLWALVGFFLLFPIFSRLPDYWPPVWRWSLRLVGWAGAVAFLALAKYPAGNGRSAGFSFDRNDIIIIVLTNMAVFGSLAWIFTRNHWLPRLGLLGIMLAIRLSNMPAATDGWVSAIWKFTEHWPASWLTRLYFLQYFNIVIPGTIAGDLIYRWLKQSRAEPIPGAQPARFSSLRLVAIAGLMFALVLVLLIGLEGRILVPATVIAFALCAVGSALLARPRNALEKLYKDLFLWGSYWLILGLFFEPYEGGIRKDRGTMSYYFVTAGLANCMLIGLSIIIDVFRQKKWLQLLIDNGQNPMIAYAGINNLIVPLLALTGLERWMSNWTTSPWLGFLHGALITLAMAVVVSLLTRLKVFWRT